MAVARKGGSKNTMQCLNGAFCISGLEVLGDVLQSMLALQKRPHVQRENRSGSR